MEAITREEKIMSGENLTPITRKEMFLAKAAGQNIETTTPITREEIFLSKIGGGSGAGGAIAYTVSSVDELPTNAVDGSTAIVPSDSIEGEWEWKDNESPLDFTSLNLPPLTTTFVLATGYDNMWETFDSVRFIVDEAGNILLNFGVNAENYLIYSTNDGWDDNYTTFKFFECVRSIVTREDVGVDHITDSVISIDDFKTFIKTNCNRLSGGRSLYTHENGEWVYKCEVA